MGFHPIQSNMAMLKICHLYHFISILVYLCFPLAFCVIHLGQCVFLMVYIVPKLWPYITTDFGGLGVPIKGDPHFWAGVNSFSRTQSGLFGDSRCSGSFAAL